MFFKYLLVDLDDTLYDYTHSHEKGIEKVFSILSEHSKKSIEELSRLYDLININLKKQSAQHQVIIKAFTLKNDRCIKSKFIFTNNLRRSILENFL